MDADYMTETEFTQLADAIFEHIIDRLDNADSDIDCALNGPVLELEFENGHKVIINRHTPNQEIWLAAKTGAYHFSWQGEQWISLRDHCELYAVLSEVIRQNTGSSLNF
jgi:CyaY protein